MKLFPTPASEYQHQIQEHEFSRNYMLPLVIEPKKPSSCMRWLVLGRHISKILPSSVVGTFFQNKYSDNCVSINTGNVICDLPLIPVDYVDGARAENKDLFLFSSEHQTKIWRKHFPQKLAAAFPFEFVYWHGFWFWVYCTSRLVIIKEIQPWALIKFLDIIHTRQV